MFSFVIVKSFLTVCREHFVQQRQNWIFLLLTDVWRAALFDTVEVCGESYTSSCLAPALPPHPPNNLTSLTFTPNDRAGQWCRLRHCYSPADVSLSVGLINVRPEVPKQTSSVFTFLQPTLPEGLILDRTPPRWEDWINGVTLHVHL